MKFLIIASYPASILKFRGALISSIHKAGFEIHIAAPEFNHFSEELNALKALGYCVHHIPMQRTGTNPVADCKTLFALYRLMTQVKPAYVMAYTIKPVIYGLMAATLARVPKRFALITGLGYAFQGAKEQHYKKSFFQRAVHQLYTLALSSTQKVFFQNPDDERLFGSMGILKAHVPSKVVNGSGVNVSEYAVAPLPLDEQAQPTIRFLLIARLLVDKGVREYAKAAQVIKTRYPQVQFDLVGWIDDNPNAIEQQELDNWIQAGLINYWGKLANVQPAIVASSIYVLPSYREGTPRTVLEAMAMGRPVITTDAPGCRETVVNGFNGYLVAVKSVDALVQAMERFIIQPETIAVMGRASRQLAEEKFDVNAVNQTMLSEMGIL